MSGADSDAASLVSRAAVAAGKAGGVDIDTAWTSCGQYGASSGGQLVRSRRRDQP